MQARSTSTPRRPLRGRDRPNHSRPPRIRGRRSSGSHLVFQTLQEYCLSLCEDSDVAVTATRYVYDFEEPSEGGRELLGGKGIGLAEMTQLGIPVPAGFTITTDACRAYLAAGGAPAGLRDPLLVSVRSGAAVSMPGMMDTVLNLGLNDVAVEGLAQSTGNARFAYDSYRRLIQMYGEVVDGVDGQRFEQALTDLKAARAVTQDVELS